jgi:hypothetical protein
MRMTASWSGSSSIHRIQGCCGRCRGPKASSSPIVAASQTGICGARPGLCSRPFEPGAVLAALETAARRLRRWPAASLDRGCARRHPEDKVGTKKRPPAVEQRNCLTGPTTKRDSHDCQLKSDNAQTSPRSAADDSRCAAGASPRQAAPLRRRRPQCGPTGQVRGQQAHDATPPAAATTLDGRRDRAGRTPGGVPRLARSTTGKSRGILDGREAADHHRDRPRRTVGDRSTAWLRPRLI